MASLGPLVHHTGGLHEQKGSQRPRGDTKNPVKVDFGGGEFQHVEGQQRKHRGGGPQYVVIFLALDVLLVGKTAPCKRPK